MYRRRRFAGAGLRSRESRLCAALLPLVRSVARPRSPGHMRTV